MSEDQAPYGRMDKPTMIATIKNYDSGVNKGFMVILSDDQGAVVEKIAVSAIILEGEPWPCMEILGGNAVKVTR